MTTPTGTPPPEQPGTSTDPWPAIDELADLLNAISTQVLDHSKQLNRLTTPDGADDTGTAPASGAAVVPEKVEADELRTWVQALVNEYGLDSKIGPPERWEHIPPLRAELLGLKIADVRTLELQQGSFELVYWHDALARVLDRIDEHADRWQSNENNQRLLRGAAL